MGKESQRSKLLVINMWQIHVCQLTRTCAYVSADLDDRYVESICTGAYRSLTFTVNFNGNQFEYKTRSRGFCLTCSRTTTEQWQRGRDLSRGLKCELSYNSDIYLANTIPLPLRLAGLLMKEATERSERRTRTPLSIPAFQHYLVAAIWVQLY